MFVLLELIEWDIIDYHVIAVQIKLLYIPFFMDIAMFDLRFVCMKVYRVIEDTSRL